MNRIAILMLGLSLAPVLCWAADPPPKASDDDAAAQLKAVQDERVKVLSEIVAGLKARKQIDPRFEFEDYLSQAIFAEKELCNALLDSTDEPEKRTALLTKQLDSASDLLKLSEQVRAGGGATLTDVNQAKSLYLAVKVKLLREHTGRRPPTPGGAKIAGGGDATATNEEYKVIAMVYKPDGQNTSRHMDPKTLETTLNELAKQGWKVRTTTSDPRYVILARPRS